MKSVNISLRNSLLPNILEDGWKFVSIFAIFSVITALIWLPLGFIALIITIICFYNFRDPVRITPLLTTAVISPADGKIISITREKGPDALGMERKNFTRICIYSGITNVHVCRIPIKGKIIKTFYDAGRGITKNLNKNDIGNERKMFLLRYDAKTDIIVQETAVFCNKRLISKMQNGDEYLAGSRYGHTRFGAYVDLFLPEKVEPQVCVGQTMVAGETVIADIKSDAPRIEGEIR